MNADDAESVFVRKGQHVRYQKRRSNHYICGCKKRSVKVKGVTQLFVLLGVTEGTHVHCALVLRGSFYLDWLCQDVECVMLHRYGNKVRLKGMARPGEAKAVFQSLTDDTGSFDSVHVKPFASCAFADVGAGVAGFAEAIDADLMREEVYSARSMMATVRKGGYGTITNCVLFVVRLATALGKADKLFAVAGGALVGQELSGVGSLAPILDRLGTACQATEVPSEGGRCDLCNVNFNSAAQGRQHYDGRRHRENAAGQGSEGGGCTNSSGTEDLQRTPGLHSSDASGCWVKTTQQQQTTLWYCDESGEYGTGYDYPDDAKMVRDGTGGLYVLCKTAGGGDGLWTLWHVRAEREVNTHCYYPNDTKMVSDGVGGCWLLASTTENGKRGLWKLWHATEYGETGFDYEYPSQSQMVGDGVGGAWVLCQCTGIAKDGQWGLWRVSSASEDFFYSYPSSSRLVGDGSGGCWVLCATDHEGGSSTQLWHATDEEEVSYYEYPRGSKMVGSEGGVWILCPNTEDVWELWHADRCSEAHFYSFGKSGSSAKIAGAQGGCWVLCKTEGHDDWCLWSCSFASETNMYEFPPHSVLIGD